MAQHFLQILFIIAMLNSTILMKNNLRHPRNAFDFKSAVVKFCADKSPKNFCSTEHLNLMGQIERERQKKLEIEGQLKRMLTQITRIIFRQEKSRIKRFRYF
jgi:hypothetical protein